ncbi:MAG: thioredoxin family protein [Flavobacterium sp.]|nr:MAG: thioredoxin family protein [Flavobacterium sp.]
MKKFLLMFLLTAGSLTVTAQETLVWHKSVSEAMKVSKKSKKPLLMFFTGSDWCGWCIRLQKEVLKTPEFATWAEKNVVLVELDFPRRSAQTPEEKQQNAELAQFFKVQGYPTVWIADAEKNKEGKISFKPRGSTGYVAGGPAPWLESANNIMANKMTDKKSDKKK